MSERIVPRSRMRPNYEDEELSEFLDRVEDLDGQNYNNNRGNRSKSKMLSSSFSIQSLSRAKEILDGKYKSGKKLLNQYYNDNDDDGYDEYLESNRYRDRREGKYEESAQEYYSRHRSHDDYEDRRNFDSPSRHDYSYKSAYIYEKTSPTKHDSNDVSTDKEDDKKYMISEDDFKLLQRLKNEHPEAFKDLVKENVEDDLAFRSAEDHYSKLANERKNYPSRGRPRELENDDFEEKPSYPPRDNHHDRDSYSVRSPRRESFSPRRHHDNEKLYSSRRYNESEFTSPRRYRDKEERDAFRQAHSERREQFLERQERDRKKYAELAKKMERRNSHKSSHSYNDDSDDDETSWRNNFDTKKGKEFLEKTKDIGLENAKKLGNNSFLSNLVNKNNEKQTEEKYHDLVRITDSPNSPILLPSDDKYSPAKSLSLKHSPELTSSKFDYSSSRNKKDKPPAPPKSRTIKSSMGKAASNDIQNNKIDLINNSDDKIALIDNDDSSDEDIDTKPIKVEESTPKKKKKPAVPAKKIKNLKEKKEAKTSSKKATTISTSSFSMNVVAPTPISESELTKKTPTKKLKEKSKKSPPVNRSKKPVGFLNSLEQNRLTSVSIVNSEESGGRNVTHTSFLDSAQRVQSNANDISIISNRSNISILPKADGFISSIAAASKTTDISGKRSKPILPSKPKKLREISLDNKDETTLLQKEFDSLSLKPVNKDPPKPPPKKENLSLPKLRSVAQEGKNSGSTENGDKKQEDVKLKKVAPPVSKRKPTLPEALQKFGQLKKTSDLSNVKSNEQDNDKDNDKTKPEEVLGFRKKLKSPPEVPNRKISMPEALKKAQMMREKKKSTSPDRNSSPTRDPLELRKATTRENLEAVLLAQKIRGRPTLTNSSTNSSGIFEHSKNSEGTNTPTSSTSGSDTPPLKSLTKKRSRGPKRRLPSSAK